MTDAFISLIDPNGRVVNVGSGMGPKYVEELPEDEKPFWRNKDVTWPELDAKIKEKVAVETTDFKFY